MMSHNMHIYFWVDPHDNHLSHLNHLPFNIECVGSSHYGSGGSHFGSGGQGGHGSSGASPGGELLILINTSFHHYHF